MEKHFAQPPVFESLFFFEWRARLCSFCKVQERNVQQDQEKSGRACEFKNLLSFKVHEKRRLTLILLG